MGASLSITPADPMHISLSRKKLLQTPGRVPLQIKKLLLGLIAELEEETGITSVSLLAEVQAAALCAFMLDARSRCLLQDWYICRLMGGCTTPLNLAGLQSI